MINAHRRGFLKQAGLGAASVAATQLAGMATADDKKRRRFKAASVNAQNKLVMGWIGCGGQATNLLKSFISQPDVAVTYVCDPETARAVAMAQIVESASGKAPKIIADMRQLLDDKSVDAVCVATPDHWHAPATILACNAGKHVYVEKPCSHNIREGRLMVEACATQQTRRAGRHAKPQFARRDRGHSTNTRWRNRRSLDRQSLEQPTPQRYRPRHARAAAGGFGL